MTILQIELKKGKVKEIVYKNLTITELEEKIDKDNAIKSDYFHIKYPNSVVQILKSEIKKISLRKIL